MRGMSLLIKVGLPGAGTSARSEQPSKPCLIRPLKGNALIFNHKENPGQVRNEEMPGRAGHDGRRCGRCLSLKKVDS